MIGRQFKNTLKRMLCLKYKSFHRNTGHFPKGFIAQGSKQEFTKVVVIQTIVENICQCIYFPNFLYLDYQ